MNTTANSELYKNFCRDGYVYLPDFLTSDEVAAVKVHLEGIIENKVPAMPPEHAFYEDRNDLSTLKQLQSLCSYDDFFYKMMFKSKFQALAENLLGAAVVGRNMQYFNKPPHVGKPTPAHQDGYYFMLEPNEAVTLWLGIDYVDPGNGCVRYVRGSHLQGMRPHGKTNTLGFSLGITNYDLEDSDRETWFSTKPGDLLAHHSLTIHRADANNSIDRTRKALGFIYYSVNAVENATAKKAYQEQLILEARHRQK